MLNNWAPGKFDAELILDGKTSNPQQITNGQVTGTNVPGAVLIPPAFGLGGVNLHTWIGWGSVPHWNAFVANLEMHETGRFFDPRLNNATQFPIAAANGFGDFAFEEFAQANRERQALIGLKNDYAMSFVGLRGLRLTRHFSSHN